MNPTLLIGDCRTLLKTLPEKHFHTCITSPPYWGLRRYLAPDHPMAKFEIGQEATPQKYVDTMLTVAEGIWHTLRDDGTWWLNLGDSYNSRPAGSRDAERWPKQSRNDHVPARDSRSTRTIDLKPKDLCGIPWRVAFALQAQGWYLRSDIIWNKPNCMPESVADRPTRSHEYIFLLTKSPTYFYDHDAIKEQAAPDSFNREMRARGPNNKYVNGAPGQPEHTALQTRDNKYKDFRRIGGFNDRWDSAEAAGTLSGTRNKRDVWTVSPAQFTDAHFATFPPELITPCVLAGTSEGGCCKGCGAPMERVLEDQGPDLEHQRACGGDSGGLYDGEAVKDYAGAGVQNASDVKARILAGMRIRKTVGWKSTCVCGLQNGKSALQLPSLIVPCRVLDPFAGSGTTGEVAIGCAREFTGIDLNPDYLPLQRRRTAQAALL